MKIGITIPNYYEPFLKEIANLNGSNKTAICSLIVENFLSYNLKLKKFPLFRKDVRIVYANEVPKSSVDDFSNPGSICDAGEDSKLADNIDRDSILEQLAVVPEDDGLGFPFDSED